MKKKFMMAAVLLGALALGSCVDDNESASVTAIREAKAAQLSALANYQQAQADAEVILANAEAKVKEADAAYQAALAKIKDLQAQEKELEQYKHKEESAIKLIKLNIKEEMPLVYMSNIIFFDNINNTLPKGMNLSSKVLSGLCIPSYTLPIIPGPKSKDKGAFVEITSSPIFIPEVSS